MAWKTKNKLQQILKQETGTIIKDWGGKCSVAIVYPNTYFVGMSNLGVHNFYRLANERNDTVCERVFLPDASDDEILSIESQRQLQDFDLIAFSVAFENDVENIGKILKRAKCEKGNGPKTITGGAVATLNPKLFDAMVDEVACGNVEENLENILIPRSPPLIKGGGGDYIPAHSVIWTNDTEFGSMHLVELQRGCPNRCKFCAAPVIYHPFIQFSKEKIIEAIKVGLPNRKKIGLIGGDVFAHPHFDEIAEFIHSNGATFSPSSIRADRITEEKARLLKQSGHKTITLAPESGSEKLRLAIGKNISDEKFFNATETLLRNNIKQIKLYFMLGLPDETDSDILEIAKFSEKIKNLGIQKLTIAVNPFVPKLKTMLANSPFAGVASLKRKISLLKTSISKVKGVSLKVESPLAALHEYEMQK